MVLYTKGILAMEKTQWHNSLEYLQKAIKLTKFENAEIVRAYAMAQYRYGNHQKGIDFLLQAYDINKMDAEIVYNLIQIYTLEHNYKAVKKMIIYFEKKTPKLQTFDKDI
jgi:tetratricopeptide (TPR) repeat protein